MDPLAVDDLDTKIHTILGTTYDSNKYIVLRSPYIQDFVRQYGTAQFIQFIHMAMSLRLLDVICTKAGMLPNLVQLPPKYVDLIAKEYRPKDIDGHVVDVMLASEAAASCIAYPHVATEIAMKGMKDTTRSEFMLDILHDLGILNNIFQSKKHAIIGFANPPLLGLWSDARMNTSRNMFYIYIKMETMAVFEPVGEFHTALCPFIGEWQSLTPLGIIVPPSVIQQATSIIQNSTSGGDIVRRIISSVMEKK